MAALQDTFMRIVLNPAHPYYASLPAQAKRSYVHMIGHGNMAFTGHLRRTRGQQRGMGGTGGLVGDSRSLAIGRNGMNLSIADLWGMHERMRRELAQAVENEVVEVYCINKGQNLGSITGIDDATADKWAFPAGFQMEAEEIDRMFVEPRPLFEGITANPTTPVAEASAALSIDKFLYLPRYAGANVVIELIRNAGATSLTLEVYALNPRTNQVTLARSTAGITGSARIEMTGDERHPYFLPVVTGISGDNIDINVGFAVAKS